MKDIEAAATILRNEEAGWVNRRDAADRLGEVAARALAVLHDAQAGNDPDVQRAVARALAHARAALEGVAPQARTFTLEELAQSCAKRGSREVSAHGKGYQVVVHLTDGRRQIVYIDPYRRSDGTELVRVQTFCGRDPQGDTLRWALRSNGKLAQCALAVSYAEDEERLVLLNNFLLSETTPIEIRDAVKEIAFYGDWLEQKLSGLDDF